VREVWIRGAAMTRFGNHRERSARDLVEEARSRVAELRAASDALFRRGNGSLKGD